MTISTSRVWTYSFFQSTVFRSCLHTYFINEDNIVFVRDEIDGLDTNFVAEKIQVSSYSDRV